MSGCNSCKKKNTTEGKIEYLESMKDELREIKESSTPDSWNYMTDAEYSETINDLDKKIEQLKKVHKNK